MIKICGLTSREDLQMTSRFQPDFLGVVCFEDSPRNVPLEKLGQLFRKGTRNVKSMLVCVNPTLEFLEERANFFEGFQLCGDETPAFCQKVKAKFPKHLLWKSFRIQEEKDFEKIENFTIADAILLDAFVQKSYGGTGKKIPSSLLKNAKEKIGRHQDLWIAGGVNAENVCEILKISGANGVDLSSSLEISPGKKSKEKIEEFFDAFDHC